MSDELPGGEPASQGPGPTTLCEADCVPLHVAGEIDYRALRGCLLCAACADLCAPVDEGICAAGGDSGCSAAASSCESCVGSPCALEQLPDTSFVGVCAAAASACAENPACVSLTRCVSDCATGVGGAGGASGGGGGAGQR